MKARSIILLMVLVIVTIIGGFFVYPKGPAAEQFANKILPWKLGLDLVGGSYLVYKVDMASVAPADRDAVMNGLRDVIEKRVNLFGVSEPRVSASQVSGEYRLNVELAGIKDLNEAIRQIGETPFLQFSEVEFKEGQEIPVFRTTELTGRYVKGSQLVFGQANLPVVSLEFSGEGATLFEDITKRNIGKELAIFLDGNLIEVARVNEPIAGGRAQITGIQDIQSAKQLVERLNAGALPAPISLINQQTVSASLGQDSLFKTIWAGMWGTIAVMLFMLIYYRGLGFFSAVALLIYVVLTLVIFKLFSVTMTLAGIAGFVLSIGMAVDANVLIFERTKEEIRRGLSKVDALEEGFKRAWTSIRDSNLSTILTALILYNFTSGFVKGFALTLFIGVLVSMFTAITATRNLLRVFYIRS